jgi:hypothetical protein
MSRCDCCGNRLPGDAENWCPVCGAPLAADARSWRLEVPAPGRAEAAVKSTKELGKASPSDLEARLRRRRWWHVAWVVVAFALLGGVGTPLYLLPMIQAPDSPTDITLSSNLRAEGDSPTGAHPSTTPAENHRETTKRVTSTGATPRFLTRDAASGRYGYADETGAMVIEPQFDFAGQFVEGLAPVQVQGDAGSAGYGFIDTSGTVIIEPQFKRAFAFSEGLARVEVEITGLYRYGFVDRSGSMVIEPQYSAASDFSEGLATVGLSDAFGVVRYGFIDRAGALVIGLRFESARDFSGGLAAVAIDGKWGYIDRTGGWAIEPRFYYASSFMPSGFAAVDLDGPGRAGQEAEPPDKGYPGLHQARIDKTGRVVSEHQAE